MSASRHQTQARVIDGVSNAWYAASHRLVALAWRAFGPTTVGVKAIVTTPDDRVLLVQPRYHQGWSLPGGGVHRGECVEQAISRELAEEVGLAVDAEACRLLGVLSNLAEHKNDYIAVFHVALDASPALAVGAETAAAEYHAMGALPVTVTPATRRRLSEYRSSQPMRGRW
jgi:ADP-ribose pyrophosphatase YjhB (NUDIX family)